MTAHRNDGFADHGVFLAPNIGTSRHTQIEHDGGVYLSRRSCEISGHQPTDVARKRDPKLRRAFASAALSLKIECNLRARHHDGYIITYLDPP